MLSRTHEVNANIAAVLEVKNEGVHLMLVVNNGHPMHSAVGNSGHFKLPVIGNRGTRRNKPVSLADTRHLAGDGVLRCSLYSRGTPPLKATPCAMLDRTEDIVLLSTQSCGL
jgi:hypothetical protein